MSQPDKPKRARSKKLALSPKAEAMVVGKPTKKKRATAERKQMALQAAAKWGTIRQAWMAAEVARRTIYHWIDTDPEFADLWHLALEDYEDSIQDNLTEQSHQDGSRNQYIATISLANNKHRDFMSRKQEWIEQVVAPILEMLGKKLRERLPAAEASAISLEMHAEADAMVRIGSARKVK